MLTPIQSCSWKQANLHQLLYLFIISKQNPIMIDRVKRKQRCLHFTPEINAFDRGRAACKEGAMIVEQEILTKDQRKR
uniref:AlNc14C669G12375 protein n=1 Tax=Albugo laibachii Nc14 TaxID=890382 RepID=F0X1Q9_9STRA|nr:AlNc14C669G12375 [Albugo laibachii Nc14]|eukprot:CCA27760.1 AlNc14C669G12375 [Albugo laibachii Nc14]